MATSKLCEVCVYVTKASVAARTGTEKDKAMLKMAMSEAWDIRVIDILKGPGKLDRSDSVEFLSANLINS